MNSIHFVPWYLTFTMSELIAIIWAATQNIEIKWRLGYYLDLKFWDFLNVYMFSKNGGAKLSFITQSSYQQIGKNTTITDAGGDCSALPLVWLVFFILRLGESPRESYNVKQRRFKILIRHYLELLTLKIVYLCLEQVFIYVNTRTKIESPINRHSNEIPLQVKMK